MDAPSIVPEHAIGRLGRFQHGVDLLRRSAGTLTGTDHREGQQAATDINRLLQFRLFDPIHDLLADK